MDGGGGHDVDTIGVPRAPFEKGAPLIEPEIRRAANGEISTALRIGYSYKDIGGYRLSLRTYEGTVPGPTLRVRPGDRLHIDIVNTLPPNPDSTPVDRMLPHHFNTTNFHFHGGHVDPGGISDNIFRSMQPGETYEVEILIPSDHTRGTYWYHPHHHGSADIQLTSGMAGVVIIEGDFDDVPEVVAANERVLVLNEVGGSTTAMFNAGHLPGIPRMAAFQGPIVRRCAACGKPPRARTSPFRRIEPRHEACARLLGSIRPLSVDHRRTSPVGLPSIVARDAHAGSGGDRGRSSAISRRISANSVLGTATSAIWKAT